MSSPKNMPSLAEMQARLASLEAENARLKIARPAPKPTLKVSQKGAVSLYGLGRWPVTLYAEQWQTVIGMAPQITAFITANRSLLHTKGDDREEQAAA